jgi:hypothetical protein
MLRLADQDREGGEGKGSIESIIKETASYFLGSSFYY